MPAYNHNPDILVAKYLESEYCKLKTEIQFSEDILAGINADQQSLVSELGILRSRAEKMKEYYDSLSFATNIESGKIDYLNPEKVDLFPSYTIHQMDDLKVWGFSTAWTKIIVRVLKQSVYQEKGVKAWPNQKEWSMRQDILELFRNKEYSIKQVSEILIGLWQTKQDKYQSTIKAILKYLQKLGIATGVNLDIREFGVRQKKNDPRADLTGC